MERKREMEFVMAPRFFTGRKVCWHIAVGWSEICNSFWALVLDVHAPAGEEDIVADVGFKTGEFDTVEKLSDVIKPYGTIPDDILSMLRDDKAGTTPLTPL